MYFRLLSEAATSLTSMLDHMPLIATMVARLNGLRLVVINSKKSGLRILALNRIEKSLIVASTLVNVINKTLKFEWATLKT